jgi:3-oxoacyl-[acyl-carrier-protein] synthase-3
VPCLPILVPEGTITSALTVCPYIAIYITETFRLQRTSESQLAKTAKPTSESDGAASGTGGFANIQMNGQEVFKFAVRTVPDTLNKSLAKAKITPEEIDHLVLHQANQRIIDGAAKKFGLGREKVVSNIEKYGNTSAGSVPIAMAEAVLEGRIKKGDIVATVGFGAGLTWASAIFRW